VTYGLVMFISE